MLLIPARSHKAFWGTLRNALACLLLTLLSFLVATAIGHYHEQLLLSLGIRLAALLITFYYVLFYRNLYLDVVDPVKKQRRDGPAKILVLFYFLIQSIFSLSILMMLGLAVLLW